MAWQFSAKTKIDAKPEEIFPYLATPDGFTKWFVRECRMEAKAGGKIWGKWNSSDEFDGKVVEVVENERFAFEWHHEDVDLTTRIDMWLEPTDGGTIFHIEEGDFPEEVKYAKPWQSITHGWTYYLTNLKTVVQHGIDYRDDWE